MLKKLTLATLSLFLLSHLSLAQVTFILQLEKAAQTEEPLYLAHNFNRWQAGDSTYLFKDGVLRVNLSRRNLLFKVCGKTWDRVEALADGTPRSNRSGYYHDGDTVTLRIKAWENHQEKPPKNVFALHGPEVLKYRGLERKIWIYLPPSYAQGHKSYPVLYLHDGQNLFQGLDGSPTKWQIARSLDSMQSEIIVVALNHGNEKRIDELSPFPQEKYGGGEGDEYLDFMVGRLKPWVDQHYRSQTERRHTLIGGSSLGGLISLYALLKYPDTFGGALIFSPAYWFNPEVEEMARNFPPKKRTFVYQMVGDQEGTMPEAFMRDLKKCRAIFRDRPEIWRHHSEIIKGGKHHEAFWRQQFPKAIQWLMDNSKLKD